MKKIIMKKITHTDLVGETKPWGKGFAGANTGRIGCTMPWSRLQTVGRGLISREQRPFTDHISVLIRQGGISDKERVTPVTRHIKKIFNEDVYPAIKRFDPDCPEIFQLTLHFNNDLLMEADLQYTEK